MSISSYFLDVLLNYIHLIFGLTLIGMLIFIRLVPTPIMRKLEPTDKSAVPILIGAARKMVVIAWICISILAVDGFILMTAHPDYRFMSVDTRDPWQVFMVVKHVIYGLLVLGLIAHTIAVKKNRRLLSRNLSTKRIGSVMDTLATFNVILGVLVLLCTSVIHYGYRPALVLPHFVHTVLVATWMGGLFFVMFIGTPLVSGMIQSQQLPVVEGLSHMQMIANRFIKILWFAMFTSIFTGFSMLFLDTSYRDFLQSSDGPNLVMVVKILFFLSMIVGAFFVTPAIIRLGELLKQAKKMQHVSKEMLDKLLQERSIIVNGGKFGFIWFQLILLATATLPSFIRLMKNQ
jgi:uncharacterized membrane protein